ncbi:MAG: MBOAT family O-acyltransferase [Oliverpabstia intestinalis]|nr:MBOAT family O-acyltransferase [Oliverpabstia intestinalis]MDY5791468.1 MBOAT family O-acyltransferase [Oliverpabstia intestinalis]
MVFSSLLFVFFFLAIHLVVYNFIQPKYRNTVLLISSLIFYSWGGPRYLILLLLDTAIAWLSALCLNRWDAGSKEGLRNRRICMAAGIAGMLLILGIFKYLGFFCDTFAFLIPALEDVPRLVLPIGISFYTFQLISYVMDVYRGDVEAQPAYWKLLLYSSLFHQCIAGPIVRYETVAGEIEERHVSLNDLYIGIRRFSIGLAKKAVLANGCASVADTLMPAGVESLSAQPAMAIWIGMIFYMLEIYLDFSAYSDMAIGMGRMVGFHYMENFNYPYTAVSVQDFWRRWHISLSSFFRDYVYIPLGGSRCSQQKYIRNMVVVWFLTGLWHGASWNFIFWGLYFFLFIYMENTFLLEKFSRLPRFVSHLYAMVVVYFGWVLFRCESLGNLGAILKGMFGLNHNGFIDLSTSVLFQNNLYLLIFCIIASTPLLKNIGTYIKRLDLVHYRIPYLTYAYEIVIPPVLLILSLLALVGNSYNPFLYFQF